MTAPFWQRSETLAAARLKLASTSLEIHGGEVNVTGYEMQQLHASDCLSGTW